MRIFLLSLVFSILFFVSANSVGAQAVHQDLEEVLHAEVIKILKEEERSVVGTDTTAPVQQIRARITRGERAGEIIEFENDFVALKEGQKFYLNHLQFIDGGEMYQVRDLDRTMGLIVLGSLFVAVVIAFGGFQGARALLSLVLSFVVIVFVLFPLLLKGYSPVFLSFAVGSSILLCAILFTHGVGPRAWASWSGATLSIGITVLVAYLGTEFMYLSGFFSDETVYLNLNTNGTLDLKGLLLGGVIIGVLGVLDDIAVTQTSVVSELKAANPSLSKKQVYMRALRVGKEHTSALVNTIVLAYTGVALPLLLLFSVTGSPLIDILNNEIFATEIMRTIAGSIGLIASVPITTAIAVWATRFPSFLRHEHGHHTHHHHA